MFTDDTDSETTTMMHKQLRIDSGNEDIKSSSCDEEYPTNVCSPQRRDGKTSWRSPTVRPKRRQHCKRCFLNPCYISITF